MANNVENKFKETDGMFYLMRLYKAVLTMPQKRKDWLVKKQLH
jgi:hypothetical protein